MFYFFFAMSFLFGAVIGSFTNCFVWRLHENETLLDRSYCPKCRKLIAWFDNIPVISFLLLRGKCRQCQKKISWQYPLVEFSTACLFSLSFYLLAKNFSQTDFSNYYFAYLVSDSKFILSLIKDWLLIFSLTTIFIYDLRWYLIPDKVALPAALILFLLNIFLGFNWLTLIFCALIGGGFFLLQFLVSNGKWVGGGDIRLGILLGMALGGYSELALAIMLTYFIGSIVSIALVIFGKKHWSSKVPLGVFLAPALLIAIFWGPQIINWYLNLMA
jgi:prepilin signal peptidase PulO-like enzyme (type II secretory pathway)